MSKERERMQFEWTKSFNQYMVLLTIIIGLFSSLSVIPDNFKIYFYWMIAISMTLFGLSVVSLNADELVYTWKGLRDMRKRVSKFQRISRLLVYLFISFIGLIIIVFGGGMMLILSGVLTNPFI